MADKTGISWTDATWNPIRGCSKVSAGCKNCYAEKVAARFSGPGQPYEGTVRDGRWNGNIRIVDEKLSEPLRWTRPRRIFVNSMSDLFHEGVPFEYVAAVFGVMAACPQHTFQVLTKRPERALEFFHHDFGLEGARETAARAGEWHAKVIWDPRGPDRMAYGSAARNQSDADIARRRVWPGWPLPNVHLGVSVEDQATADARIPALFQCPAAVRFVSYEPALGPVDFTRVPSVGFDDDVEYFDPLRHGLPRVYGSDPSKRLHWIIVGGESGPNARPFDAAWARSTIAQCRAAGVACFVKQLGARPEFNGAMGFVSEQWKLKDKAGADPAEWPEDLRVQEFPEPRP